MAGTRITLDNFRQEIDFQRDKKYFREPKLRNLQKLAKFVSINLRSPLPTKFVAVSITERRVDLLALVATKVTKAGCNLSRVQVTRRSLIEEH